MKESLYGIIKENMNEETGLLPDGFCLPDENPEEKLKFAMGAKDGIYYYHTGKPDAADSEGFKMICDAFEMTSDEKRDEAFEMVHEAARKTRAIAYIGDLQNYIQDNRAKYDALEIYLLAVMLAGMGYLTEAVKVGLSVLALFDTGKTDFIMDMIRTLGACDEFSLFAAYNMMHWDNPDRELFEMAKRVKGWGRIHAIRLMKDIDEETEDWLVLNGVNNAVMGAYSALDVYEKVHFVERIVYNGLDLELYRGLAAILSSLLDEGPADGISKVDDKYDVIDSFIEMSVSRHDLDSSDISVIMELYEYLEDEEDEKAAELAQDLILFIMSDRVKAVVEKDVAEGKGFDVARILNINYQDKAFEMIEEEPLDKAYLASQLIADGYKVDEIIVRRHIVGGSSRTLISALLPPRLRSRVGDRKLSAGQPHAVAALLEKQESCF